MAYADSGATGGAGKAVRVLIVDDSVTMRGFVALILQASPHIALAGSVGTGEAAMALVAEEAPDVAVVDLELPDTSGCALATCLREAGCGVVMLSASPERIRDATACDDIAVFDKARIMLDRDAFVAALLVAQRPQVADERRAAVTAGASRQAHASGRLG